MLRARWQTPVVPSGPVLWSHKTSTSLVTALLPISTKNS